jgi:hypothetical protein
MCGTMSVRESCWHQSWEILLIRETGWLRLGVYICMLWKRVAPARFARLTDHFLLGIR